MMITHCPRCHEPYRVPGDSFPADAYAKCPWCHETFPLQEALRRLPPVLKIIGADGRELTGIVAAGNSLRANASAANIGATAYAATSAGIRREIDTEIDDNLDGSVTFDPTGDFDQPSSPMQIEVGSDDELDPEFVIRDAGGTQTVAPRRVQPLPPLSSSPRRKKKGSPIKTLLGVALGPVIAIPAAAGILLGLDYMGIKEAPNLGVWPMDGSYSSMAASTNRTAAAPMPSNQESNLSPSPSNPPQGRSLGEELGTTDTVTVGSDPATEAFEQIGSPDSTTVTDTVTTAAIEATSSIPEVSVPEVSVPEVTMPEVAAAEVAKPSVEIEEPLPSISEPALPEAPATPPYAPELVAARDKAMELIDQLGSIASSDAKRKPVLVGTYVALANIGSLLEQATAAAGNEVVAKLKADESLLNDIASATSQWLKLSSAKRPSQGVIIVGELETSGDKPSIRLSNNELVSVIDADESITSGKVIGLGKIIDGPNGQSVSLPLMESL
jgi:hypothetical protein